MTNFISNGCEKLWEVEEEVKGENNGYRLWDGGGDGIESVLLFLT